jgi:hypothetical protein
VSTDAVLHLAEGLIDWGLDVSGINPLHVLDVTRDNAPMKVPSTKVLGGLKLMPSSA